MKYSYSSIAFAASLLLSACGGGGSSSSSGGSTIPPGPKDVSISFDLSANGSTVKCGTALSSLGSKASAAELQDARFYLSNIALIDSAGNAVPVKLATNDWQNDQVALISFNDGSSSACGGKAMAANDKVTGTVPAGNYQGIQYEIGVPESLNHTDYATAAKPMNVAAMAWSWTSGRKYMLVEVNPKGGVTVTRTNTTTTPPTTTTSTSPSWYVHLGSTGCTSNATSGSYACTNSNRMLVKLANFNLDTQKISLDLNALLAGADLSADNGGAPGCMSGSTDPECKAIFNNLKIDLASGNANSAGVQSVFVVKAK